MMGGAWKHKKATVGSCKAISTIFLLKHGYLRGNIRCSRGEIQWSDAKGHKTGSIGFSILVINNFGEIRFQYALTDPHTEAKKNLDYPVQLTPTPCYFGGRRWWFRCPLNINGYPCLRRVEKLYLRGQYFGCRKCHNLTYASCQESDKRVNALLRSPGFLSGATGPKLPFVTGLVALSAEMKAEQILEGKKRKRF